MTLLQKQFLFSSLVSLLLKKAEDFGYQVTLGGAWREGDPRCHGIRLAIDINLFKDGQYLTDIESHRKLGEWWKTLNPICRWGGDFVSMNAGDANHYSITHGGIA
jgi:hypothetical protein